MKKRIVSLFIAFLLIFNTFGANAGFILAQDDAGMAGYVRVIVENTTYPDGGFYGTLIDVEVPITEGMTMMDAVKAGLAQEGCSSQGGASYISGITDKKGNQLSEYDGGYMSGWMGTLNDWFTNAGFTSFTVKDGDEVRIMYTCEYGGDIGQDWYSFSTKLKNIEVTGGSLSPDFFIETKSYTLKVGSDVKEIKITPTAENKTFQVKSIVNGIEYERTKMIPVENGTKITVRCGDPSWAGSSEKAEATDYEITVVKEGAVASASPEVPESPTVSDPISSETSASPLVSSSPSPEVPAQEYRVELYSVQKSMNMFHDIHIENEAGDVIPFDTVPANARKPYVILLPAGTYYYVFTNSDNKITAKDSFEVTEKEDVEEVQNIYLVEVDFTVQTNQLYDDAEDYQHGAVITLKDPNGTYKQFYGEPVSDGKQPYSGYSKCCFVIQAKGLDYVYSYTVQMCDKRLMLNQTKGTISYKAAKTTTRKTIAIRPYAVSEPVTFVIPKDAGIGVYKKGDKHYTAFYEYNPIESDTESLEDYDIYTYSVPTDSGSTVHVTVGGLEGTGGYLKTTQIFHGFEETEYLFEPEKLDNSIRKGCSYATQMITGKDENNKNITTMLYDTVEDDMFLNIDDSNYLTLKQGETFALHAFRVTQAQKGATENYFIEPDFHYEILSGDSVSISKEGSPGNEYAALTAVSDGLTVIRVTYDAMQLANSNDSEAEFAYYNACDPLNERIVIVNVSDKAGTIVSGINEREYDTIFYADKILLPDGTTKKGNDYAEYTFTPKAAGKVKVSAHAPLHQSDWNTGWKEYPMAADGSYTISLYEGENIVKMESGEEIAYYTISAKSVTIKVTNDTNPGQEIVEGDTVTVSFDTLRLPNKKMAGIYNPGFPDTTWTHYDVDSEMATQNGILDAAKQKNGMVRNKGGQYIIASPYGNAITFQVLKAGKLVFTNGKIHSEHFGSALNAHRTIGADGLGANLDAANNKADAEYSTLPDFSLEVLPISMEVDISEFSQMYQETGNFLRVNMTNPTVSSIGGEWAVLGLARSGVSVSSSMYSNYLSNVIETLKASNGILSTSKYTEYSRVILALTAIGVDVTNVGGYHLLDNLSCMEYITNQGVNGPIWALIALDSKSYDIPVLKGVGTQTTRERLIEAILQKELTDGGWAMSGTIPDPDITAMCIQALAPYYGRNATVAGAVDRALQVLSRLQNADGSYSTYGNSNAESIAQVIVALTSLGIDPTTDSRFIKNRKTTLHALAAFYVTGGGFRHIAGGTRDGMATEQGYYALTAYFRYKAGENSLYDMNDIAITEAYVFTEQLIEAIPNPVTIEDAKTIEAARASYDALTMEQKEKVSMMHLNKLLSAEADLKKLLNVDSVEKLIKDIGTVTLESEEKILNARAAYNLLTEEEQKLVTNYQVLVDAEAALQRLKEELAEEKETGEQEKGDNKKGNVSNNKKNKEQDKDTSKGNDKTSDKIKKPEQLKEDDVSKDSENNTIQGNVQNITPDNSQAAKEKDTPERKADTLALKKDKKKEEKPGERTVDRQEKKEPSQEEASGEIETAEMTDKQEKKTSLLILWSIIGGAGIAGAAGSGIFMYRKRRAVKAESDK